jgi:hypothetical protein
MTNRKLIAGAAVLLVAGMLLGSFASGSGPAPHPWAPAKPRPVLKFLARAAKTFLWIALVAERNPTAERPVVQASIGSDGYATLDNRRGW